MMDLNCAAAKRSQLIEQGWLPRQVAKTAFSQSTPFPCGEPEWDGVTSTYAWGPVGTGKTHLGYCLLNTALRVGVEAAFLTGMQLHLLFDNYRTSEESEDMVFRASKFGLLMIDDIDKAVWSVRSLCRMFQIFDDRQRDGLPSIITSNFPLERLGLYFANCVPQNETLGIGLLDRLKPCRVVKLEGGSLR